MSTKPSSILNIQAVGYKERVKLCSRPALTMIYYLIIFYFNLLTYLYNFNNTSQITHFLINEALHFKFLLTKLTLKDKTTIFYIPRNVL